MSGRLLPALAVCTLLLSGCAHPEDRRWVDMDVVSAASTDGQEPSVTVYTFEPPKPGKKTSVRDLSDRGQAALIEAMARSPKEAAALRKLLAAPLEGEGSGGAVDETRLARTIVISVRKGPKSLPGDRLMRTVITLTPHVPPGETSVFEFAGYTIAATDRQVMDIARLETSSSATLSAGAEPSLGPLGAGSVGAEVSQSHKSSADIVQQFENLGVDILPHQLVITRESERGLDVVGNTLIALTLQPTFESERTISGFLAKDVKLYDKGAALAASDASMDLAQLDFLSQCDLIADVRMDYQLRRIVKGREFYTEGKQKIEIINATETTRQPLVRGGDVQPPLFVITNQYGDGVSATKAGGGYQLLYFGNYGEAKSFANWLSAAGSDRIGANGVQFRIEKNRPWSRTDSFKAQYFGTDCGRGGSNSPP